MKVYEEVYEYYRKCMVDGRLETGSRMPSLREASASLSVSRTSVETAYNMLQADGYILSREKVGYFVTELAMRETRSDGVADALQQNGDASLREEAVYCHGSEDFELDLTLIGEDAAVSCLELWRRYMKSALRQENRLLTYGASQGEEDLRIEIASYVKKTRNIICSPDDIVVGAGFQNLLLILLSLMKEEGNQSISFPTKEFTDGARSAEDMGYEVSYRDKSCDIIYVTPSYMTKWGDVMTMKRRMELLHHGREDGHVIIEDDFQHEFDFSKQKKPSLYAMSGGEGVAYLGSFSRVVLPSVRISFLILPRSYRRLYEERADLYNQSASKAEQIALAQFLRDGHMMRHIHAMERLYAQKRQVFYQTLLSSFSDEWKERILMGDSGMEVGIRKHDGTIAILSCSRVKIERMEEAISLWLEGQGIV